jgi:hypothetical protein
MGLALIAAVVCVSGLLLTLEAARRERATFRQWHVAPTPKGERVYSALEGRVRDLAQLVDVTLARAVVLHRAGAPDEARRVLAVGRKLLKVFVADMLGLHAGMAEFSRSAEALGRAPRLPARRLRTPALAWRAHLCNLVQPFLVTAGERFRLRLVTLRNSLLLLNGIVSGEQRRRGCEGAGSSDDWQALEAARADLETLTGATLANLNLLLSALAARPRVRGRVLAEEPR